MLRKRAKLAGLVIDVLVGDPWELARSAGSEGYAASIAMARTADQGADEELLLIEFREPVEWKGVSYRFFVASRRNGKALADDLLSGRSVTCCLTAISDERASSSDPFDISWWRGGLAALATVEPKG